MPKNAIMAAIAIAFTVIIIVGIILLVIYLPGRGGVSCTDDKDCAASGGDTCTGGKCTCGPSGPACAVDNYCLGSTCTACPSTAAGTCPTSCTKCVTTTVGCTADKDCIPDEYCLGNTCTACPLTAVGKCPTRCTECVATDNSCTYDGDCVVKGGDTCANGECICGSSGFTCGTNAQCSHTGCVSCNSDEFCYAYTPESKSPDDGIVMVNTGITCGETCSPDTQPVQYVGCYENKTDTSYSPGGGPTSYTSCLAELRKNGTGYRPDTKFADYPYIALTSSSTGIDGGFHCGVGTEGIIQKNQLLVVPYANRAQGVKQCAFNAVAYNTGDPTPWSLIGGMDARAVYINPDYIPPV